MRNKPYETVQEIYDLLKLYGPMTGFDLAEEMGTPYDVAKCALTRMQERGASYKVHVYGYVYERAPSGRRYLRRLYSAGKGKNAPRPERRPKAEIDREWHQRKKWKVASVFDLGRV